MRKIREKLGKPYITLTCFEGYFTLQGHPEDLKILYQAGMGLRTGQGFGMVEVVKIDLVVSKKGFFYKTHDDVSVKYGYLVSL